MMKKILSFIAYIKCRLQRSNKKPFRFNYEYGIPEDILTEICMLNIHPSTWISKLIRSDEIPFILYLKNGEKIKSTLWVRPLLFLGDNLASSTSYKSITYFCNYDIHKIIDYDDIAYYEPYKHSWKQIYTLTK